jgi:hypothetical protein
VIGEIEEEVRRGCRRRKMKSKKKELSNYGTYFHLE